MLFLVRRLYLRMEFLKDDFHAQQIIYDHFYWGEFLMQPKEYLKLNACCCLSNLFNKPSTSFALITPLIKLISCCTQK